LDVLAAKIKSEVTMDGLLWGEAAKKVPLAFGIFKLQVYSQL
jgi:translation elongation factor EF-1beta